jgi:hypothetical protein
LKEHGFDGLGTDAFFAQTIFLEQGFDWFDTDSSSDIFLKTFKMFGSSSCFANTPNSQGFCTTIKKKN